MGEGKQFGEEEELSKGANLGVLIINSIVCVVGGVVMHKRQPTNLG